MIVNMNGYLEVIFGPMFSGKTTHLIQKYKQHTLLGHKIAVVNYMDDKRYSKTELSTHDNLTIECMFTYKLNDLLNDNTVKESRVIIINEGQFFDDLLEFVLQMVEKEQKVVYVCGLDSDFQRNKFGQILDLVPYSDNVVKLKSLCMQCRDGTTAIFSKRITKDESLIVIGSDNYIPLCRKCYLTL